MVILYRYDGYICFIFLCNKEYRKKKNRLHFAAMRPLLRWGCLGSHQIFNFISHKKKWCSSFHGFISIWLRINFLDKGCLECFVSIELFESIALCTVEMGIVYLQVNFWQWYRIYDLMDVFEWMIYECLTHWCRCDWKANQILSRFVFAALSDSRGYDRSYMRYEPWIVFYKETTSSTRTLCFIDSCLLWFFYLVFSIGLN